MVCLVLGVQGLLGFKGPQKMVVSIQRLRSTKAGWSTGGRALTRRPLSHPSIRKAYTQGPADPRRGLRTAGAVSEPGASPGGARPLGEGSASAGLSAPLPQLSRMSPGAAGEGPNGCPRSPQGPPWKTSLRSELGKGTSSRGSFSGGRTKGTPTHFRIQEGQMIGLGHHILRLRGGGARTRVGAGGGHSIGKNDVAPGSD